MEQIFSLAPIFSDGAVLQRDMPLRIFGAAPEGAQVTVSLGEQCTKTLASRGCWQAELAPMSAGTNLVLTASCRGQTLLVRDIAIGEVWIAGGQSNMEFWLRNEAERDTVIPAANDPLLRFFDMPRISYEGQERDFPFGEYGIWRPFLPEHAGWFSAVGAYFGRKLRQTLNVPVAIVGCNCGATSASCWLEERYLTEIPALLPYKENYEKTLEGLDEGHYREAFLERQAWGLTDRMVEFDRRMARGEISPAQLQGAMANMSPRQWELLNLPSGPMAHTRPFALYSSMVKRLAPYTARGVIWYQGESDEVLPDQYASLFGQVVRCWRETWQQPLPFLTVQLAPFGHWLGSTGAAFPALRRQQALAAETVPDVWMTSIMDHGMEEDIHPKFKRPVGERLALLARGKVYGEKDLLCDYPRPSRVRRQGNTVTIQFEYAGDGLHTANDFPSELELLADGEKTAFTAKVQGDILILTGEDLEQAETVTVCYGEMAYVKAGLYSSAGLCAAPFTLKI